MRVSLLFLILPLLFCTEVLSEPGRESALEEQPDSTALVENNQALPGGTDEPENQLDEENSEDKNQKLQADQHEQESRDSGSQDLNASHDNLKEYPESPKQELSGSAEQPTEQERDLPARIPEMTEKSGEKIPEFKPTRNSGPSAELVAIFLVATLFIFAYFFLWRKITLDNSRIIEYLSDIEREMVSKSIQLDERLLSMIGSLLSAIGSQLEATQKEKKAQEKEKHDSQNHTFVLKVSDEITRIEKNISQMSEETKGIKQVSMAVRRIRGSLASNGYEIVEMLGRTFEEGMKVEASFRTDENLKSGEKRITRVIKPQVNFGGTIIQVAQVEVSQGEESSLIANDKSEV